MDVEQIREKYENGELLTYEMLEILKKAEVKDKIKKIIPEKFIDYAKTKMTLDLVRLLLDLIYADDYYMKKREIIISQLAGVVGTVWANEYVDQHLAKEGSRENEFAIEDKSGTNVTDSDIKFEDKEGIINLVELKTTTALIEDVSEYPHGEVLVENIGDETKLKSGEMIPRDAIVGIKYNVNKDGSIEFKKELPETSVDMGKKVVIQAQHTRNYVDRMNRISDKKYKALVFVYKNTKISDSIRKQIEEYAEIVELPIDISEIFDYVTKLVECTVNTCRNIIKQNDNNKEYYKSKEYDVPGDM